MTDENEPDSDDADVSHGGHYQRRQAKSHRAAERRRNLINTGRCRGW